MNDMPLEARRLLAIQASLTVVLCIAYWVAMGQGAAMAACFGGLMALGNAWLMGRTVVRATEAALRQPGSETFVLLSGAVLRFALVAALFATGLGLMSLAPVPLLVGFAVVHGAFFLSRAVVASTPAGTSRKSQGE